MPMTFPLTPADGTWRDMTRHGGRQLIGALALPLAIYVLFGTPPTTLLSVLAVVLVLNALLTWGRLSWGKAIAMSDEGIRVVRRDGTSLEIPSASITHFRTKPDCFVVVWTEPQKRRNLVVAREGFAPATWTRVLAAAQAFEQARHRGLATSPT